MNNSSFLSIKEAADYLQVDYKVVYRLVKEGRLRASRVGWQFRITPTDIEAYLQSQLISDRDETVDLEDAEAAYGGTSAHHEVNVRLPQVDTHMPLPREDSKKLESYVCDAFIRQMSEVDSLVHPVSGVLIRVQNWSALYTVFDERTNLLDILDTAFLDRYTLATTPLNSHIRYSVEGTPPLSIELKFLSHLSTLAEQGVDAVPATGDELVRFLDDTAPAVSTVRVLGCVSPTGWDEHAIKCACDQAWLEANHLLLYLIDARTGRVSFDAQSKFTRRFAGLYGFADAFRTATQTL